MKYAYLKYILIFCTIFFSFFSWLSVDRAINIENSSVWLVPAIWFSFYFISLCLSFILIKEKGALAATVFASFLLGFIFIFDFSRIVAILIAFPLAFLSVFRFKNELTLNIKIDLRKIINSGKALLLVSLAIMISSQYYSEVKGRNANLLVPKFNLGAGSGKMTAKIISAINPQFKNIESNNLTVDDFIAAQMQNGQLALSSDSLDSGQMSGGNNSLIMEEGRTKLSELAGKKLTGEEKISDVFGNMVNDKISSYFTPTLADNENMPFLPALFALILFLTAVSLGDMLMWVLIPFSKLIFKALVRINAVKVNKVMAEVEVIES